MIPAQTVGRPLAARNAPTPRELHTAVWTGLEMIVWGGNNNPPLGLPDHGWEILRGTAGNPHTDANSNRDRHVRHSDDSSHSDTNTDFDGDCISALNAKPNSHRHCNGYGNRDDRSHCHADTHNNGCANPRPRRLTATAAPTQTPTPSPVPPTQALNLSTRMRVQTGDNVGIGGFIVTGSAPKHVVLRAIGPSLAQAGVLNQLADPVLELHGPAGFIAIINDNWRDDQEVDDRGDRTRADK